MDQCGYDGYSKAFKAINDSLLTIRILALPDPNDSYSVVCDASHFDIGSAPLRTDVDGRDRVIALESHQLKAAERNTQIMTK